MDDKAIRAAKLTLSGMLEKKRAKEAKDRAGGQIAPSKYLPDVPRQAHASGGYVPEANLPVPRRLATAAPLQTGAQPTALDVLSSMAGLAETTTGLFGREDEVPPQTAPSTAPALQAKPSADHGGMSEAALAAWSGLTDAWGQPLTVTSAYRDPKRNEEVGGANNSQHMHGNAYDVDTSGMSYDERLALADAAWNAGFRGIGFYDNSMHFDVADPRAWGPSYSRDSIPDWALPWATERYGYADGGEVTDLGQVREQKQLQGFHKGLMNDMHTRMTNAMDAHQKAVDAGVFDGYEVGDVLKGSAHPMRITGRYMQKWKPTPMAMRSFERMGAQPTIVEHEGEQYIPMLRYQTGVEGEDGFQEGTAYLDGVKAAGYQKMGGLRAVKADGGSVGGDDIPNWSGNPDFQKWFGASKAVDETGSPLVLYHGTNQNIDQFDPKRGGTATGENAGATKGFFFTDNKDVAQQYADRAGRAVVPNVVEHERETKRLQREVARLEAAAHRTGNWDAYERAVEAWEDHEAKARNASDDEGKNIVHAHLSLQNPKIVDFGGGRLSMDRDLDSMIEEAKAAGHDGMILKNLEDSPQMGIVSNHYVAFAPHQIKSVHNSGRFDPKDPRIHRADGGSVAERSPMFEGMHEDLRDESGKPMDLWHGTPHGDDFDQFDNAKLGARDAGFYGRGHYLTPDRDVANEYTIANGGDPGEGQIVGPLHAALKNPYVWDASDKGSHRTLRDLQSMGIMREKSELEPWDNLQRHHIDPFMREMQKRGHDGVLMKTNRGLSEVVVFNPNMIKHRDAEVGDPNDPRIMRADGGAIDKALALTRRTR